MISSVLGIDHTLKRYLRLSSASGRGVEVRNGNCLIQRVGSNHLSKEVFGLAVSEAREVNRPVTAFGGKRETGCAAAITRSADYTDSFAGPVAVYEPVDVNVCGSGVLSGRKELDRVAVDHHRLLDSAEEQLKTAQISFWIKARRRQFLMSHSIPAFFLYGHLQGRSRSELECGSGSRDGLGRELPAMQFDPAGLIAQRHLTCDRLAAPELAKQLRLAFFLRPAANPLNTERAVHCAKAVDLDLLKPVTRVLICRLVPPAIRLAGFKPCSCAGHESGARHYVSIDKRALSRDCSIDVEAEILGFKSGVPVQIDPIVISCGFESRQGHGGR